MASRKCDRCASASATGLFLWGGLPSGSSTPHQGPEGLIRHQRSEIAHPSRLRSKSCRHRSRCDLRHRQKSTRVIPTPEIQYQAWYSRLKHTATVVVGIAQSRFARCRHRHGPPPTILPIPAASIVHEMHTAKHSQLVRVTKEFTRIDGRPRGQQAR